MGREKKIVSLGVRMPESMLLHIKAIAIARGVSESDVARKALSELIDKEREYFEALAPIFGEKLRQEKIDRVLQRGTSIDESEDADLLSDFS